MTHETSALTRRFEVVAEVYCKPQTNDGREGRRLSAR